MGACFSAFMFKHKIPATAASFSIGAASADMAKTMAQDLVMPLLYGLAALVIPVQNAPKFQIAAFANSIVVWLCVLVTSFVLMEYLFARGVIGMSTVVLDKQDKASISKAREQAAEPLRKAREAVQNVVGNMAGVNGSEGILAPFAAKASATAQEPRANAGLLTPDNRGAGTTSIARVSPARIGDTLM